MTDLLRREHAPIPAASFEAIDEQARELLESNLSARRIVDVHGPFGWHHAAVNLGRLDPGRVDAGNGVVYGIRKVLPLVELRVPFELDLWQLDDVVRGGRDPELGPLIEAAGKFVSFEERAIYYGLPAAGIVGMAQASQHAPQVLGRDSKRWPESIAHAAVELKVAGEAPPYLLVTGPAIFQAIERDAGQYPLRKQIEALIAGPILLAPYVDGAFLVPANAEGDFELVLGQDASIGFEQQLDQRVRLYLTESFTFRVLEPQAVVVFQLEKG